MSYIFKTAVLCGGKSTRMGTNKSFLQYEGKPFVERITDKLSEDFDVVISAARASEYEYMEYPVYIDEHENIGPIEGIYQILRNIDSDYVFICAVDMPFITSELVMYMKEFISSDYDCYVIRDDERIQPLCAIYFRNILPIIERHIVSGRYKLMDILNNTKTKYIELKYTCFDKNIVRNVNTPEEYRKLVLPIVFCVSGIKNSGKTSLIVKLICKFKDNGYKVGVIKHDGHDFSIDHEGTDTYKFSEAGADISSIFSDTKYCINGNSHVDEIFMQERLCGMDIIILEGFKYSKYPKVEVVRGEVSDKGVCDRDTLICMASDIIIEDDIMCPVYNINDIDAIFVRIRKYFGI